MTLTINTPEQYTVNTVGTSDMSVAVLSETLAIGLYYNSTAGELQAVTATISSNINLNAVGPATVDANAKNTSFAIAKLSSTKAIAIFQDGGGSSDIYGRIINITGSSISSVGSANVIDTDGGLLGGSGSIAVTGLSSTAAITVYRDENDSNKGKGRALDVSGDTITPGAELTIINNAVFNVSIIAIRGSSTQAIFTCLDNGTTPANRPSAHVLTKSGSTLSAGSQALLEATATPTGHVGIASMSSSVAVATYENNGGTVQGQVLGISGSSITTNTSAEIDSTSINANVMAGRIGANTAIGVYRDTSNRTYALEVLVSGTSVSGGTPVQISSVVGENSDAIATVSPYTLIMYGNDMVIVTSSNAQPDTTSELDIAPMRKPADIDADGTYVYIAALNNSGNPVLIKILGDLSADGDLVFNPGAGDDIGVECGNFNADVVWVAGAFDSTNVVEKTEDGGTSFVVKDDGTFGDVSAFRVGPDSDDRILIVDENQDIHETIDDGDNWTTHQTAVGIATKSVARLDKNVQEIVLGNVASANINIQYSVNTGANLQDYSDGFPEIDVTGLEVG